MYTNILEALDYLLPLQVEADDFQKLAEQDFNNNTMFIQNTTNCRGEEFVLIDNGFTQIEENLFEKDGKHYQIVNFEWDNFAGKTVEIKEIILN
jgi:hypothetical protein